MKKHKFYKKLSVFVFYFSILSIVIAFNFSDNPAGGWQLQTLPFLNNRPLRDMTFTDSLTGYGITKGGNGDSDYVIKTSNGGDNWSIMNTFYAELNHIKFINSNTGFICGGDRSGNGLVLKTTNGGINWFSLNASFANQFRGMFVLNEDTIWLVDDNGFNGGVFRTVNGGNNWILQFFGYNPTNIYMANKDIGFINDGSGGMLLKTINGGFNWTLIPGQNGFNDMFFLDSLTGWKCKDSTRKTTDGGITWDRQFIPTGGIISGNLTQFSKINKYTIWGSGGTLEYSVNRYRGILYYTSNGGNNWFYQIPDTSFGIPGFKFINFISPKIGWANESFFSFKTNGLVNKGVHTKTSGDTTFYTGIQQLTAQIPEDFILKQNYPNPFNPRTVIPFSLKRNAFVKLIVYDVKGAEVQLLAEGNYNAGEYEVDFMGKFSSSGVYFYRIFITQNNSNEVYTETKRMILLK